MLMAEMSRRFNFDDFDELCREALDEHAAKDHQLAAESEAWEEAERWSEHDTGKRPGEIGGVVVHLTLFNPVDFEPLPPAA